MLRKILVVLFVLLSALVLVGLMLPKEVAIRREISIAAPPAKIHALIGDLKRWDEWAPWKKEDPTVVTTFGDKTSGVGAHQKWTGKDGAGRLTLTKSDEATGIAYDMAFLNGDKETPFQSAMEMRADGQNTIVAWTMNGAGMGAGKFIDGWLRIFITPSIEKMFDQGLADLKKVVEKG
jgi:uncharacterized protein YndB with AHSA1/START domain